MTYSTWQIWFVIIGLSVVTYFLRFSFIGLVGDRKLPEWLLRHLRYTAVAVLPALIAPLVLWPNATGGEPDAARLAAAFVAMGIGVWTRNIVLTVLCGMAALYLVQYLVG